MSVLKTAFEAFYGEVKVQTTNISGNSALLHTVTQRTEELFEKHKDDMNDLLDQRMKAFQAALIESLNEKLDSALDSTSSVNILVLNVADPDGHAAIAGAITERLVGFSVGLIADLRGQLREDLGLPPAATGPLTPHAATGGQDQRQSNAQGEAANEDKDNAAGGKSKKSKGKARADP